MEKIIAEIRSDLQKSIDNDYKNNSQNFFKEGITLYGVRTPIVRKIGKDYFKKIKDFPKKEILSLCESLLKSNHKEEITISIQWMAELNNESVLLDFQFLEDLFSKYINNWGTTDDFCLSILSHFIVKYPDYKDRVKQWTKSSNLWKRRASAVSFIQGGSWKIHEAYLSDIFDVAITLMGDKEDLVQKGYGWMLKVTADTHQQEVFNFVERYKSKMSRTALRYAIEKMPQELRKKAMQK